MYVVKEYTKSEMEWKFTSLAPFEKSKFIDSTFYEYLTDAIVLRNTINEDSKSYVHARLLEVDHNGDGTLYEQELTKSEIEEILAKEENELA